MKDDMKRINFEISLELAIWFKRFALDNDIAMSQIIIQYIKHLRKTEEKKHEKQAKSVEVDGRDNRVL